MKKLILLAIAAMASPLLNAQQGWTIYNSANTNLYGDHFYNIEIDQAGNVWANGEISVAKFNGSTWTQYTESNSDLISDIIYDIAVDNNNGVWVATGDGISVFNGNTITNFDTSNTDIPGEQVYVLEKGPGSYMWMASKNGSFDYEGVTYWDGTNWITLTGYPSQIDGDEYTDFAFTPDGNTWIGGNGITKYNSGTFNFYPYASTGFWSTKTFATEGNNVWAGGFDGILHYNASNADWTVYDNVDDLGLTSNTLYYRMIIVGNYIWIASSAGVLKFNKSTGVIDHIFTLSNSPLPVNGVGDFEIDDNGVFWFATSAGIIKMDPTQVGINEEENTLSVGCFPNPANDKLTISSDLFTQTNGTALFYDINGKQVLEQPLTAAKTTVDISTWAKGLYYARISVGNKAKTLKVSVN